MSERYPKHVEGSAQGRSLEEQHRLMAEFEETSHDEGLNEDAFNEKMANTEYEANAATEARILDNPETNRMYMMAQHIAELRANDGDARSISDKENKLQELLEDYTDKARAARDTELRNAEMERDTPKGREIRRGKEVEAEEELERRQEEVDFIINSTDEAWVNDKTGKTTEVEKNLDTKTAAEIDEMLKKNPEFVDDPRVKEQLEALRRALNGEVEPMMEPFGNKDVVVHDPAEGKKPFGSDDLAEARRRLKGTAFDEADLKAAREKLGISDTSESSKPDDEEKAATPEDVARANLLAGFKGNPVPEIYADLPEEEETKETRSERFGWAKKAYRRAGLMFANGVEKFRGMSRNKKLGIAAGTVALVGAAVVWKLGLHDHTHHVTGSGSGHSPENPAADMKADYDAKRQAAETAGTAFSPEALKINPGEGWLHELSNMDISQEEAEKLLPKILDSKDRGIRAWTYLMGDGNPGISHPGKIPPSVLESIQELRNQ